MNYKQLIDRYLSGQHIRETERRFCISIYWEVEVMIERNSRMHRLNHVEILYTVARLHQMSIDEIETIYGIGKEQMDLIDKIPLKNIQHDSRNQRTSLLHHSGEIR